LRRCDKLGQWPSDARDGGALQLKSAAKGDAFNAVQKSLLEATLGTDVANLATRFEQQRPSRRIEEA